MKFRKKPVVVEAMQFDGSMKSANEIMAWATQGRDPLSNQMVRCPYEGGLEIVTLEGTMRAFRGDWVIKGVLGEFYPCNPSSFSATYEAQPEGDNP